jgi:hypothetical protein
MLRKKIFRSKLLALELLAAFLLLVFPMAGLAQTPVGSMYGFVYGEDLKTPVEKAVVKVRNIKSGKEYESAPTDKNGLYKITDIEEGRYVLGVSTSEGDFNFDFIIYIKANESAKLSVALKRGYESVVAQKAEKAAKKKSFFLSPEGILVLLAGGAAAIAGTIVAVRGGTPASVSPSSR